MDGLSLAISAAIRSWIHAISRSVAPQVNPNQVQQAFWQSILKSSLVNALHRCSLPRDMSAFRPWLSALGRRALFSWRSFVKRMLVATVCLGICQGCQWRAPSPLVHIHLSRIFVERIDEPQGQWLRQRLQHVLGGPCAQPPLYRLTLECQSATKPWALNRHGQTMWTYVGLDTMYTLTTHPQGRVIASGRLRLSGSLPTTAPYYSDTISQEAMDCRLRERLVQQMYSRLTALMTRHVTRSCTTSRPNTTPSAKSPAR